MTRVIDAALGQAGEVRDEVEDDAEDHQDDAHDVVGVEVRRHPQRVVEVRVDRHGRVDHRRDATDRPAHHTQKQQNGRSRQRMSEP